MTSLFDPFDLAGLALPNRIVMAPMTRSRARHHAADTSTATYYAQRASAGLIISEGTQVSNVGQGYLWTPGIHSRQQVDGWRLVTDAVHGAGGRIFAQLWHVGRMSHVSLHGEQPVSSVAGQVSEEWPVFAYDAAGQPGQIQASPSRALTLDEIPGVVDEFARAATNAVAAGFDGVELHSAGTYLLNNFISGDINTRDDAYGGEPIANRLRFVLETVAAVTNAIGSRRVGIRICPEGRIRDNRPYPSERRTFLTLVHQLSPLGLAYVHINDLGISASLLAEIRRTYRGTLMLTGEQTQETAAQVLKEGIADLIGFGRPYIGNPDLVERFRNGWPLTVADPKTYYGGGDEGYIDFSQYGSSASAPLP